MTALLIALDVALILVAARLMGGVFARLGQPAVIGEILTGFLLGPSVLGALPGDPSAALFPEDVRPALKAIGNLGLAIFMFTIGLSFDSRLLRLRGRAAATISLSAVVLPFALGVLLAAYLYGTHDVVDGSEVAFTPFALFIGVSMSITAFPVLARILVELGLRSTRLGSLVLAAAAVDDVLGWSLLAVALAVVSSEAAWSGPVTLVGTLLYSVALIVAFRPWLGNRLKSSTTPRLEPGSPVMLACVLIGLGVSAALTEAIGVHFVFGAFLFGAAMPREAAEGLFGGVRKQLEPPARLLLPIFFVTPGLSVDIGALGARELGELGLILAIASAGKFVGAGGSALLQGIPRREAVAIGVLMNTRGLMELVVLSIGLEAAIIDDRLFTELIVMAIVTTVIAAPLLRVIAPRELKPTVAGADVPMGSVRSR